MADLRHLQAKQQVLATTLTLDAPWLDDYHAALGLPSSPSAPPLALVARSMALLMQEVQLPPGTIHASQSYVTHGEVAAGDTIEVRWVVSRASTRAGAFFVNLDLTVSLDGTLALAGTTNLIVPGEQA